MREEAFLKYVVSRGAHAGTHYTFSMVDVEKELHLTPYEILGLVCELALRGVLRIREMPYSESVADILSTYLERGEVDYALGRLFKSELTDRQAMAENILKTIVDAPGAVSLCSPSRFKLSLEKTTQLVRQLGKLQRVSKRPSKKNHSSADDKVIGKVRDELMEELRRHAKSLEMMISRFSGELSEKIGELDTIKEKPVELEIRHTIGEYSKEEMTRLMGDVEAQKSLLLHEIAIRKGLLADSVKVETIGGNDLEDEYDVLKARVAIGEIGLDAFEDRKKELIAQLSSLTRTQVDEKELSRAKATTRQLSQTVEALSKEGFIEDDDAQTLNQALASYLALMEKA